MSFLPAGKLFLPAALLLLSSLAQAQNQYDLGELLPGQLLLNLSATEQIEVAQDTLIASLEYSAQGRDKTALQNEVNGAIRQALTILEAATDVEYSTQQYQVYIFQAGKPSRNDIDKPLWRAQQSLQLRSKNSSELLETSAKLQTAGLHISNLYYTLSTEKYEATADSLMGAALEKLQARARQAALVLHKTSAELIEVSLNDNQSVPFRVDAMAMRAGAADSESFQTPSAEPGTTQVAMTVSARALLSP